MGTNPRTTPDWDRALLDSLFRELMDDCLCMLLLRDMALIADDDGRAPIGTLAQRFRNFFSKRHQEGKQEERIHVLVSNQSLEWWQRVIAERATVQASDFFVRENDYLAFRTELWTNWTPGFRKALRNVAETRLIEYFETRVDGGW